MDELNSSTNSNDINTNNNNNNNAKSPSASSTASSDSENNSSSSSTASSSSASSNNDNNDKKSSKKSKIDDDDEFEEEIKRPKRSSKGSNEDLKSIWQEDPDLYGIRRSGRERKQPNRLKLVDSSEEESKTTSRKRSSKNNSDDSSGSDDDNSNSSFSSEAHTKRKRSNQVRVQPKRNAKGRQSRTLSDSSGNNSNDDSNASNSSEDDDSNSSNSSAESDSYKSKPKRNAPKSSTVKKVVSTRSKSRVNYCEDNASENDEEEATTEAPRNPPGALPPGDTIEENVESIEKVLKRRMGRKGATGSRTAIYNVEENGDPNENFDEKSENGEEQYLIKWAGWSYLHNTWESRDTLLEQRVKGMKKFENFLKKEDEIRAWKSEASPEDIEYLECQSEMLDNLLDTHTKVERVIAHNKVRLSSTYPDYLCKWDGLPYAECTWEDGELIHKRFPQKIVEYEARQQSQTLPHNRNSKVLRTRPRFVALKEQPYFLGKGDSDLVLRDYQLDGLNWLANSWCKQNAVILADEMGLGKTIQAISFLSYVFNEHQLYGPFLIVIPLSTIQGWQREFTKWCSEINVVLYLGDINSRNTIQQYEMFSGTKRMKCNAVLTTYEILLKDKSFLSSISWSALVVDEAHRLKNDDSILYRTLIKFDTNHRLLITGTPLQNSLKELWALVHFIMPDKFDEWDEFDRKYSNVLKDGSKFLDLHKELAPYLLRRVKKDVEKSLPAKVEQILRVEMTKIQKQYSKLILARNFKELSKGAKGSVSSFQNIMMELKKCCNHAYLIRRDDEKEKLDLENLIRGSGKLILLDKLLRRLKETGHRVLIFSQMVRMLDIIAEYLQARRFPFQRLDGSIKGELRRQALDHFNREDSEDFCFLLSTRAGGLGINLATADTVIIYDSDWNPQNDLQAQARAHRIGQKNQVNIYRLVTKNSIEENIIETAKQKMVLDHIVIQRMDTTGRTILDKNSSGNSTLTPFTKEELNSILKFRAEELFKKEADSEENREELDIDEILKRAETRDESIQLTSAGEELLSQFKVANFSTMEDDPIVPNEHSARSWHEIIPEADRNDAEREEEMELLKKINIGSRRNRGNNNNAQRQLKMDYSDEEDWKKDNDEQDSGGSSSDEDSSGRKAGSKRNKTRNVDGFTTQEVRRFLRSYKKFAAPLSRIDMVAQDAELEEKSRSHLIDLANRIQSSCLKVMQDYEKSTKEDLSEEGKKKREKGPTFTLNGVKIYAQQIIESEKYFEPLVHYFGSSAKSERFEFKARIKLPHWDCVWSVGDDVALLNGINEHGYSNWEAIKIDGSLGLADKILIEAKKPQSKHLQTRVDYLMKLLLAQMNDEKYAHLNDNSDVSHHNNHQHHHHQSHHHNHHQNSHHSSHQQQQNNQNVNSNGNKRKSKHLEKADAGDSAVGAGASSSNPPRKKARKATANNNQHHSSAESDADSDYSESNNHKKKKVTKGKKVHQDESGKHHHSDNDTDPKKRKLEESVFIECKDLMRPVKRALKNIDVKETGISDEHEMDKIKRHLLEIGDRINECVSRYSDPDLIKEWRTNLWIFVSKFTTWTPDRLKNVFKKLAKTRDEHLGLHNQDSNDDSKYKKALDLSHSHTNSANPSPNFANKFIKRITDSNNSNNNEYAQAGWCSSSTPSSSNRSVNKPISTQASSSATSSSASRNSNRYDSQKSSHHYNSHHHSWNNNGSSHQSSYGSGSGGNSSRKSWQAPSSSSFSHSNEPYSSYAQPQQSQQQNRNWHHPNSHSAASHHHQRNQSSSSQMNHHRTSSSSSSSYHHHNSHHHHTNSPHPPPVHHTNISANTSRKSSDISFKRSSNLDPRRRSEHLIKPPEPT